MEVFFFLLALIQMFASVFIDSGSPPLGGLLSDWSSKIAPMSQIQNVTLKTVTLTRQNQESGPDLSGTLCI
jgi:hypothetical protein